MWSKCRNVIWNDFKVIRWCSAHRAIHRWIDYLSDGRWTRHAVFISLWMLKLINDIGWWMLKTNSCQKLLLGRQWQTTQCNPLIDSGRQIKIQTNLVHRLAVWSVAGLIRGKKTQGHETGMFVLYRQGRINSCSLPWIDAEDFIFDLLILKENILLWLFKIIIKDHKAV